MLEHEANASHPPVCLSANRLSAFQCTKEGGAFLLVRGSCLTASPHPSLHTPTTPPPHQTGPNPPPPHLGTTYA